MSTKPAAKRARGRPAFKPAAAQRRQVSIAAAGGMRHDDIAIAIGVCRETLAKHFELELSAGAAARRMEVLNSLYLAAKKGSSSAAKAFLAADPLLGVPPPAATQPDKAPAIGSAPSPATKMGKKEQAQADAETATDNTEWASLLGRPSAGVPVQ